jgi:hypothetical protein
VGKASKKGWDYWVFGQWAKSKNSVIPSIICPCQNPLESASKKGYYKEEERLAG